ncbi:hypothetical protein QTP70_030499 [Hemibagrus guttatus]|uniref:Uncharacterized protein n=1 Tax=Hemibagrus guttatus TaxID=175788 RepID=A0AAE0VEN8_9TELE|nr:hypothetical protein QTP70_030499 [Hemibagrus guttatus]
MPINLQCMSLDWGRKPEYPEETPEARGEHANSTHTWWRRESNPQPWRCEANVLTKHSFIVCRLSELHSGHGEPVLISGVIGHQGRIHPGWSANPSQGTYTLSFTHAITHYRQFRDANQPTMHVFGLGEETGAPGGNPQGTGRTCKLHTHMAEAGIEPPTLEV